MPLVRRLIVVGLIKAQTKDESFKKYIFFELLPKRYCIRPTHKSMIVIYKFVVELICFWLKPVVVVVFWTEPKTGDKQDVDGHDDLDKATTRGNQSNRIYKI